MSNSNARESGKPGGYKIQIDKDHITVDLAEMTGTQILALVNKTPDKWLLREMVGGKVEPVEPAQTVNFSTPGLERFMTVPNTVKEGDATPPRREFPMLPLDAEFLNSLGLKWECINEGAQRIVIIYGWSLPPGYNTRLTDVHLRLSEMYPDTEIDMAYFCPALARADGKHINNLSSMQCDGRSWQQWSRHRTDHSKWRTGIDDLATHMALVGDWLQAELRK